MIKLGLLISAIFAIASACEYSCKDNYDVVKDTSVDPCGYYCKPKCRASVTKCGGTLPAKCPTIACSDASAGAVALPGSCAAARASVETDSMSSSASAFASACASALDSQCGNPKCDNVAALAVATAQAHAKAIAKVVTKYQLTVCKCGKDAAAFAAVKSQGAAVAEAYAAAFADAVAEAKMGDCFGDTQAFAAAEASAVAYDVQTAVENFFAALLTKPSLQGCVTVKGKEVEKAVANAIACAWAKAFAAVCYNEAAIAEACSDALALAGVPGVGLGVCKWNFCD